VPDPVDALNDATLQLTEGVRELQGLVNRISADVGSLVAKYQPAAVRRLTLAIDDLTASIGRALLPVLERFRVLVRGIGDSIASLTPSGRAMVAGLVAAGVGMASLTAATVAFSVAVNTSLGGIPAVLGAVAGGAVGVAFAMKDLAEVQAAVEKVARAGTVVLNALGKAVSVVFDAVSPLIDTFAGLAAQAGGQLAQLFTALAPAMRQVAEVVAGLVTQLAAVGATNFQTMLGLFQTLANALTPLIQPLATVVGTVAQLGGVLTQVGGVLLNVFLSALAPALTGLGAVLQVLVTPINLMSGLFASLASVVSSVVNPLFRTLGELLSGPFKALGAIWQAVFSPIVDGIQALTQEFGGLGQAFGEVGALVGDISKEIGSLLAAAFKDLKGLLPDVVNPLRMMADAVRWLTRQIRDFVRQVREFLGLPDPDTFTPGASQGMAVRETASTSVRDDLRKAQLAALASGGKKEDKPEVKTANTLVEIWKLLRLWDRFITAPREVAGRVASAADSALGVASPGYMLGREAMRAVTGR
jgi:phage-related protein